MLPKVLLCSVFKPFAVNNIYSREESKIELLHNQITKYQGVFSIRASFNSYGLHAIANNIEAPATVLDFPTLPRFIKEVKKGYDIIGIGGIMPNFQKIKKMTEIARELSPHSILVVGGFCAVLPNIDKILDVDYVCVGEGISFMRDLIGLPSAFKYKNPHMYHADTEVVGIPTRRRKYPHIAVGLGCPYGCDFCSPSHFFGRRHIKFYERGRELFEEMKRVTERCGPNMITFVGDDNFLIDLERAEELRECVVESGEMFEIFLFGSADQVMKFGAEKLAEMGVSLIWIGRESRVSKYPKNRDIDFKQVVAQLRRYGIKTILSSILLQEEHTKENIHQDIEEHLACAPVFSQFAHFSPVPGTPLYERLEKENRILHCIPVEEQHAFKQPWFVHPHFNLVEAEKIQEQAYIRDFLELGPSHMRWAAAELEGWRTMKDSDKPHLRKRAAMISKMMWKYKVLIKATEHLGPTEHIRQMARGRLAEMARDFGPVTPLERSMARLVHLSGRIRELRTALWGDAIQPPTRLVKYNQ